MGRILPIKNTKRIVGIKNAEAAEYLPQREEIVQEIKTKDKKIFAQKQNTLGNATDEPEP